MKETIKSIFSRGTFSEIIDDLQLRKQPKWMMDSLLRLPTLFRYIYTVFVTAPYLLFINFIIAAIFLQFSVFAEPSQAEFIFAVIVALLLTNLSNELCYIEAKNTYSEEDDRIPNIEKRMMRRSVHLLLLFPLLSIVTASGIIFFVIPGIYFALKSIFSPIIVVTENTSIKNSITESFIATRGSIYNILSFTVIISIILILSIGVIGGYPTIGGTIITIVMFTLLAPTIHIGLAILYLNSQDENNIDLSVPESYEKYRSFDNIRKQIK